MPEATTAQDAANLLRQKNRLPSYEPAVATLSRGFVTRNGAVADAEDAIAEDGSLKADLTLNRALTPAKRTQAAKNLRLAGGRFTLPEAADASEDVRAYIDRLSIITTGDGGGTSATVEQPSAVFAAINALYTYVGKSNLIDAWFLSTLHNVISGTTVPAFKSATNNGTMRGSVVPTFAVDGAAFDLAKANGISLPDSLLSNTTDFTDIVIFQPGTISVSGTDGLIGCYGEAGGGAGYWMGVRRHATPNNEYFGQQHYGDGGTYAGGYVQAFGKPDEGRWQTGGIQFSTALQSTYLNGRLVATSTTGTHAIGVTNRHLAIGAAGWTGSNMIQTFTGKIIFAAKITGRPSAEVMCRLMSALRGILQPQNGGVTVVGIGDSRVKGALISGGNIVADVTAGALPEAYWLNSLMATPAFLGKAAPISLGISGITATAISKGGLYQRTARQFSPGWQTTYCIIWAGINDMQPGVGGHTGLYTYNRLKEIADLARADGMIVVIINQPASTYAPANFILQLNNLLATSPIGDVLIDAYSLFTPAGVANPTYWDDLHSTSAGNLALCDLIALNITPETLPS